MQEKITLDMLTKDSVSVKKQEVIEGKDGELYDVGQTWRKAYVNSIRGREEVQEEVEEPYKSVILLMWGDEPTVVEEVEEITGEDYVEP